MKLHPLFSREQIAARVRELGELVAAKLPEDNTPMVAVILMKGAMWFAADLLRHLPPTLRVEPVRVSSYGNARTSSGQLTWHTPCPTCNGCRVLLVDDVLDTGLTLQAVQEELLRKGATQVLTAVAVDKQGARRTAVEADYAAFRIKSGFLVGYGMDCAEAYRNLPYIAELSADE